MPYSSRWTAQRGDEALLTLCSHCYRKFQSATYQGCSRRLRVQANDQVLRPTQLSYTGQFCPLEITKYGFCFSTLSYYICNHKTVYNQRICLNSQYAYKWRSILVCHAQPSSDCCRFFIQTDLLVKFY